MLESLSLYFSGSIVTHLLESLHNCRLKTIISKGLKRHLLPLLSHSVINHDKRRFLGLLIILKKVLLGQFASVDHC